MTAPSPGTGADEDGLAEVMPCECAPTAMRPGRPHPYAKCPARLRPAVRAWHTAHVAKARQDGAAEALRDAAEVVRHEHGTTSLAATRLDYRVAEALAGDDPGQADNGEGAR